MGRVSTAKQRLMDAATELIWEHSYGSTTVDAICDKAVVKKGSFYYFFESKSDLAIAAIEEYWRVKKPINDSIFSPTVAPLDRFARFFEIVYNCQAEMKAKLGQVLGCPLFSLGCEISTQDEKIRGKVEEILNQYVKYFETAIRDAHALGQINAPDGCGKARLLFAYFQGVLTQAKIANNLEPLRQLNTGCREILGMGKEAIAA